MTPRLHEQYRTFRSQFVRRGVPLITMAVGAQYEPWHAEFPEVRVVEGDLLFQQPRLWAVGARVAEREGFSRFVCVDADVVFEDVEWIARVEQAFRQADLIQPFETALHLYDDARTERVARVARIDGQSTPLPAFGLGLGFDSRFLDAFGPYEHGIVGGSDKILWNTVYRVLPLSTAHERRLEVGAVLREAGYPENADLVDDVWRWAERGRKTFDSPRLDWAKGVRLVAMPFGRKEKRAYRERYSVLGSFSPDRDLYAPPGDGLSFASGCEKLKADVERYLRSRAA